MLKYLITALCLCACATEPEPDPVLLTGFAYSFDPACPDNPEPNADQLAAAQGATALWREWAVTVTPEEDAGPDAFPVSLCFVDVLDSAPGRVGATRVADGSQSAAVTVMRDLPVPFTAGVLAHEFMHLVTWSTAHSEAPGLLHAMGEGATWSDGDIAYLEDWGLEYGGDE
jgi:hypothetical protein